ncbi:PaaI family thioesterase [Luteithermobacter gelatinilyticus]|uniref:PaaI family thioesterase n=1 Tax=Luteithermobacter gelatinilyticus TaxID=2582913 RepID=UPI001105F8D5|nr:PaaI family thioesterase [Luteithermobacter gelatinilyticus]|tara:strand:- start:19351 stop:19794 length:444 start_codon:yes stop_codon:yes gene_type:complete
MIIEELIPLKDQEEFTYAVTDGGYGEFLNIHLQRKRGELLTLMKFDQDLIGTPYPPALHGGTIAALLEIAAYCQLAWETQMTVHPKTVDINIDYLRSGKPLDTWARAKVFRMGRRFANLHVEAWQDNPEKPIATAHLHFLIIDPVKG